MYEFVSFNKILKKKEEKYEERFDYLLNSCMYNVSEETLQNLQCNAHKTTCRFENTFVLITYYYHYYMRFNAKIYRNIFGGLVVKYTLSDERECCNKRIAFQLI